MKKLALTQVKAISVVLFLSILNINLIAQYPKFKLRIPSSWIDSATMQERSDWFKKDKAAPLSKVVTNGSQTTSFTIDISNDLSPIISEIKKNNAEFVNVYIGANTDNKLVLILSLADEDRKNLGAYYLLDGQNITPTSDQNRDVLTRNYRTNVLPELDGTIPHSDDDDYDEEFDIQSDTRLISYRATNIIYLKDEADYQQKHYNKTITKVRIDLISYTAEGNKDGHYAKRMITSFHLVEKTGTGETDFSIDSNPTDFKRRLTYTLAQNDEDETLLEVAKRKISKNEAPIQAYSFPLKKGGGGSGNDNGQICPANCPTP